MHFFQQAEKKRRPAGFTLIEIMIAMAIVTVLLGIAVPNFLRARDNASRKSCLANVYEIERAKDNFALDRKVPEGTAVGWNDICPAYIKQQPKCPSGGEYEIGGVGSDASCSIPDHNPAAL